MNLRKRKTSALNQAIFREQREIRKERLLASPALIIGAVGFLIILLLAVFVPLLNPTDPNAMEVANRLQPPSGKYLLGTDEFGRDLFVRVMYGARVSLWVGGCVAVFSCILGTIVGVYASYFKVLDQILMRICDGLIAIPGILLAIALIAALGTSSWNVILALTIVYTPSVARTVRASAMVIREQAYVEAAKVQGFGNLRILWRMILPGVISPLTVQASFIFAQAIISEASLSFLGAGIPAPAASWGNMLEASKLVFSKAPWTMICPGAAVILCVMSLNLLGDGLRDFLDPRVKGGQKK
ncbi:MULTISPECIES: ABC transporter permease [Sellimonas]|uniref:ABC transporter permease n=1 Tax=Sellimonas caecigallum TaxID=2592333 RepID=A0ABS7L717_9FIRM|nr:MULTISPECIES: ABC transporter permease [Sellimonas]MBY0758733.1 ABC transporter permease [Sellimonas caecigallum]OUP00922.1 peptide ABC transporter permease [Drancourtella sp. An210]OUP63233.1 peptide ABC transporter permease [Drancourtella sp. An177]